jgi:hypothetical protein
VKVKVLYKLVKHQGQGHQVFPWYPQKGFITWNSNLKYHNHDANYSKVIAKAKGCNTQIKHKVKVTMSKVLIPMERSFPQGIFM